MASTSNTGIKTDEKKQHFDDIYMAADPVPFKEQIIDKLDYISDNFNREHFDRLILPWCQEKTQSGNPLRLVDLCACFGNTTLAAGHGMTTEEIRENWKSSEACKRPLKPRRLPLEVAGIDISGNALAYGKNAGIFDETIQADLNNPTDEQRQAVQEAMSKADVVISTASLVYLEVPAIEMLIKAYAEPQREGYVLVNFLNPFNLEKADQTKRLLLEHLDFVGSAATRHRKLSALEREGYPDEEWALLEIWVLRRRS